MIEALKDEFFVVRFSASEALKEITTEYFGMDYDEWKNWWKIKREKRVKAGRYSDLSKTRITSRTSSDPQGLLQRCSMSLSCI